MYILIMLTSLRAISNKFIQNEKNRKERRKMLNEYINLQIEPPSSFNNILTNKNKEAILKYKGTSKAPKTPQKPPKPLRTQISNTISRVFGSKKNNNNGSTTSENSNNGSTNNNNNNNNKGQYNFNPNYKIQLNSEKYNIYGNPIQPNNVNNFKTSRSNIEKSSSTKIKTPSNMISSIKLWASSRGSQIGKVNLGRRGRPPGKPPGFSGGGHKQKKQKKQKKILDVNNK